MKEEDLPALYNSTLDEQRELIKVLEDKQMPPYVVCVIDTQSDIWQDFLNDIACCGYDGIQTTESSRFVCTHFPLEWAEEMLALFVVDYPGFIEYRKGRDYIKTFMLLDECILRNFLPISPCSTSGALH